MKVCATCKESLPLEQFYERPSSSDGKVSNCKKCSSRYMMDRWIATKEKAIQYLGGKCVDCEKSYPRQVYDFHHLNPSQKEMGWNKLKKRSWNSITKELSKCVLLCSNCHRIRHLNEE